MWYIPPDLAGTNKTERPNSLNVLPSFSFVHSNGELIVSRNGATNGGPLVKHTTTCPACGDPMSSASLPRHRKYHCHSPNITYTIKPECSYCHQPISRPGHTLKRHIKSCPARLRNRQALMPSPQCQLHVNNNQNNSTPPTPVNLHIPSTAASPPLSSSQDTINWVFSHADASHLQFLPTLPFSGGIPGHLPEAHPPPQSINQRATNLPVGANPSIQPLSNMPGVCSNKDYFQANPSAHQPPINFDWTPRQIDTNYPQPPLNASFPGINILAPSRSHPDDSNHHTPTDIYPPNATFLVGANPVSIQPTSCIPRVFSNMLRASDENCSQANSSSAYQPPADPELFHLPTTFHDDHVVTPPPSPAYATHSGQDLLFHNSQDGTRGFDGVDSR
ncbi:hypothetical protein BD779DRAFT_138759 [Infundibulicybe gibba]|nr:hypothetical protein BD779DRAFT_138759 [Infundibulicybe gibba]